MAARATQDSLDLGWSDEPLAEPSKSPDPAVVEAPLEISDDDEPTRVATSASFAIAPTQSEDVPAPIEPPVDTAEPLAPAVASEATSVGDTVEAEATSVSDTVVSEAASISDTVVAVEPATPPSIPPAPITPPPSIPPAPIAPPPSIPPASIAPPPLPPTFFTPVSLAPTASDWNESGLPSFLETMKRTRPTSAWTGVALFFAACTFVGGIGIGHGISPPSLPPVPVPAAPPPPPSIPAASPADALASPPATAPTAPPRELPPFDAKAARAALDKAALQAKACRAAHDPKGAVATTVTFASTGHVSDVAITSARYAGTKTGTCVAERLSEAKAPEFSGFPAALKKTVAVR